MLAQGVQGKLQKEEEVGLNGLLVPLPDHKELELYHHWIK
jgi:hypothetical protein